MNQDDLRMLEPCAFCGQYHTAPGEYFKLRLTKTAYPRLLAAKALRNAYLSEYGEAAGDAQLIAYTKALFPYKFVLQPDRNWLSCASLLTQMAPVLVSPPLPGASALRWKAALEERGAEVQLIRSQKDELPPPRPEHPPVQLYLTEIPPDRHAAIRALEEAYRQTYGYDEGNKAIIAHARSVSAGKFELPANASSLAAATHLIDAAPILISPLLPYEEALHWTALGARPVAAALELTDSAPLW